MGTDIPLKCKCGQVKGKAKDIDPDKGNRIICMCDDCQNYMKHLGKDNEYLDQYGGTDIFQMTPSQISIEQGHEHIQCVKMTEKGILRWYAGCCNTPIANTLAAPGVPFAGMPHSFMDHEADGISRDEALGPFIGKLFGKFAIGQMPEDAHPKMPFSLLFRTMRILLVAKIAGKAKPNPFFNEDGKPVSIPVSTFSK